MNTNAHLKVAASKVAAKGVTVDIGLDDTVIDRISRTLALTVFTSNDTVGKVLTLDKLQECFSYSLRLVVQQGMAVRPRHEQVPKFFADITMALKGRYRGVEIQPELAEDEYERPHSYDDFLAVLNSIGVHTGKLLKVMPETTSKTLLVSLKEFNDEPMLVGVDADANIEEMILRSMLTVSTQEQEKLDRILGHCEYMYAARDELCRQWATSLPIARGVIA